jgi:nitroimidazol reductase NimA-like FMN-containing flavoprotein (pyridoxamine 5'-phosphate oxidase superfamily)
MGPQPAFEPGSLERFVQSPRIGVLSYVKKNGVPAQAPIWYRYRDGRFEMLTSATSPKAKALTREGRACLTIQDELPPYRAVIVDGNVSVTAVSPEHELSGWLATHYFGKLAGREYEKMAAEENRETGLVLVTLDPSRVRGFDNHRMIGAGLRLYMRVRDLLPIPRTWL